MKRIHTLLIFSVITFGMYAQTINDSCQNALPFCTGMIYNYPAGVNSGTAQIGPNYGCLASQPNPAWYYMNILYPGVIEIEMHSVPQMDIDFVVWGPFTNNTIPCNAELIAGTNTPTHDIPGPSSDYPSMNMIDCSYSVNYQEYLYIPNAQPGEYYIVLITNFSNQPCNIIFNQTNFGQVGAGVTNCQGLATAEGRFFYDANQNLVYDSGELPIYGALAYSPSCNIYFMSDQLGRYASYICAVPDSIIGYYNHPYIQSVNPVGYLIAGPTTQADFAVYIEEVNDLELDITNINPFVPGFTTGVRLNVTNNGVLTNEGLLRLDFDSLFTYESAVPAPDSVVGNSIYWHTAPIGMLGTYNATAYLHTDSSLALGTPYLISGEIISDLPDTNLLNNVDVVADELVASFDPNDKQVDPEGMIDNLFAASQPDFEYIVRFQNTGSYFATTVKITDTLSGWLDIPTFKLISSSHPCTYEIKGPGIVEFTFSNIMLPASVDNEAGSHGYVKFSVKCRPELELGGEVYNRANIYFDYNAPVITNTVLTYTRFITGSQIIPAKENMKKISVFPNPATDNTSITFSAATKKSYAEISDASGKVVMTLPVSKGQTTLNIDLSSLKKGNYNVSIYTGKEKLVEQLVIE